MLPACKHSGMAEGLKRKILFEISLIRVNFQNINLKIPRNFNIQLLLTQWMTKNQAAGL